MIWYLILGIIIGMVIGLVCMYLILEYHGRKMFLDKPFKKRAELFPDEIFNGIKEKINAGNKI